MDRPARSSALALALVVLAVPSFPRPAPVADCVILGGNARERAEIQAALRASAFDWRLLPDQVVVHVGPGLPARARPGHVWLSRELLGAGRFAWAVIQEEFAHQVEFLLLDDGSRRLLDEELGGDAWYARPGVPHGRLGSERFAATFVWAYWPSRDNVYRPRSPADTSAAMAPARFRALLAELLASTPRR